MSARESCATGLWTEPDVPHKGWICYGVTDRGEPSATCEMCQAAQIRYAHHMHHDEYADDLEVGCVCAEHMAEGYEGHEAERQLRADARRKKREAERSASRAPEPVAPSPPLRQDPWSLAIWRESKAGNSVYRRTGDGYVLIAFYSEHNYKRPVKGDYGICIKEAAGETVHTDDDFYSEEEAKQAAEEWVEQHRRQTAQAPVEEDFSPVPYSVYDPPDEEAQDSDPRAGNCATCGRPFDEDLIPALWAYGCAYCGDCTRDLTRPDPQD